MLLDVASQNSGNQLYFVQLTLHSYLKLFSYARIYAYVYWLQSAHAFLS